MSSQEPIGPEARVEQKGEHVEHVPQAPQGEAKIDQELQEKIRQELLTHVYNAKKVLREQIGYSHSALDLYFNLIEIEIERTIFFSSMEGFKKRINELVDEAIIFGTKIKTKGEKVKRKMDHSVVYSYNPLISGHRRRNSEELILRFRRIFYDLFKRDEEFDAFKFPLHTMLKLRSLLMPLILQDKLNELLIFALSDDVHNVKNQGDIKKLYDFFNNGILCLDSELLKQSEQRMNELSSYIDQLSNNMISCNILYNLGNEEVVLFLWSLKDLTDVPENEKDKLRRRMLSQNDIYPEELYKRLEATLPKLTEKVAVKEGESVLSSITGYFPAFVRGKSSAGDSKTKAEQRLSQLPSVEYNDCNSLLDWNLLQYKLSHGKPFDREAWEKQIELENDMTDRKKKTKELCEAVVEFSTIFQAKRLREGYFLSTSICFLMNYAKGLGDNLADSGIALLIDELHRFCNIKGVNKFERLTLALNRITECFAEIGNFRDLAKPYLMLMDDKSSPVIPLEPKDLISALIRGIIESSARVPTDSRDLLNFLRTIKITDEFPGESARGDHKAKTKTKP